LKRLASAKARSAAFCPAASGGGVVAHDPAQHRDVVGPEGGAAGGDRRGDAGEMARHDVGVALDDDHAMIA
jgi:hypothetical protein